MKIYTAVMAPIIVSGTFHGRIVPTYIADGGLAVPFRGIVEQRPFIGLMNITMDLFSPRFHHPWSMLDDEEIQPSTEITLSTSRSFNLELGPRSDIYTQFPNGFMLYPGRLRENFPQNTQISMIVNPENPANDGFCTEGSLFYSEHDNRYLHIVVDTKIVPDGHPIQSDGPWIRGYYQFKPDAEYDYITDMRIIELSDAITPGNLLDLSGYLNECDLENRSYPSIHFRVLQRMLGPGNQHEHIGTIVYYPNDYMEQLEDGRCRFKIRTARRLPSFGRNFMRKIAIHFESDRIGFCDPTLPSNL
jgi:hypothetical protein